MDEDWAELFPDDVRASLTGRTIFLTGAGGFLGQYVHAAFQSLGAQVLAPRRRSLDLTCQADVDAFMRENQPMYLVHLAAECGGIGANVAHPGRFLYANALMGLILLESARVHGVEKTVVISTTCAYPQDAPLPLQEDTLWMENPPARRGRTVWQSASAGPLRHMQKNTPERCHLDSRQSLRTG